MRDDSPLQNFSPDVIDDVWLILARNERAFIHERDDIMMGAAHLATRRARLLGQGIASRGDLTFTLSIFTWWPMKPQAADDVEALLLPLRNALFSGLGVSRDFAALDKAVPDDTLRLDLTGLFQRQQSSLHSFLSDNRPMRS